MYFDTIQQLFAMDGHGVYVWFCYAATICVLVGVIVESQRRRRRALAMIRIAIRRKQAGDKGVTT